MRRVLLMIDEAKIGGGQQHVLHLATLMKRFEPHVACEPSGHLVDELRSRSIPVHALEMSNRPSIRSLRTCRTLVDKLKPAIVHTHGGTAGFTGRIGTLGLPGRRVVHTYHGLHYLHGGGIRNESFRLADALLVRVTNRIVCVAQSDLELGIEYGVVDRKKAVVIRNGIETSLFGAATGSKIPQGPPVIGTIGRLHVQKGHSVLIEAAAELRRMGKDVIVRIIGDGDLRESLESEARTIGVEDIVKFKGSSHDTAKELAEMDLFVLPSLWEGLPLVLLEAMAAGVPVVASNVDGIPEIVADGQDGILVPPKNPVELASAIARLLDDHGLRKRLTAAARERVNREFSADRMVKQTEDLYEDLLSEGY